MEEVKDELLAELVNKLAKSKKGKKAFFNVIEKLVDDKTSKAFSF
jgi:predicted CopG family antitoxin